MANTLTNLIPDVYAALDVVSRELIGFIPSVARDPRADRVAIGQTLRSAFTSPNIAGGNITPAMALPAAADQTIGNRTLTITKSRYYPFSWTGVEQYAMDTGPGFLTIQQDQIAQAIRAAVNEMEVDIAVAATAGSSRAYGTAGTTPFATDLSDTANVRKMLDDNGAPMDRTLVISTTAGAKLRTLTQLTKANEAADSTLLRQGTLLDVHGIAIRESAAIQTQVAGTGASATTNAAGYAIGATVLTLASAGTGTLLAGDIITFAGDNNKYVIASGDTDVSNGGTITLASPGLLVAMSAATKAITVVAGSVRDIAFSRNAIVLATRLPEVPREGDLALDRQTVTDPRSGISLEVAAYPGFRMIVYHISVNWGVAVIKPEHVVTLLG